MDEILPEVKVEETNVREFKKPPGNKRGSGKAKDGESETDKPKPDPEPTAADLYEGMFLGLTRSIVKDPGFPDPDFTIEATYHLKGLGPIKIEGDKPFQTAVRLDDVETRRLIARYARQLSLTQSMRYRFTSAQNGAAMNYWLDNVEISETPVPIAFKSTPGVAFHRLDFDPWPGTCSLWEEFLSRITNGNADALEAFIWSLLEPKAYLQHYLWIQGEGNDGKGAFVRFVRRILGLANVLNLAKPPGEDRHESTSFVGKRALIFSDFENFQSLDTTAMKMLTGGDNYPVRPLGGEPFDTPATWRLIFTSNRFPNLSDTKSNQRRPIFVSIKSYGELGDHSASYEDDLWEERAVILHRCRDAYQRLCPDHGPIPTSEDSRETLAGEAGIKDDRFRIWMGSAGLEFVDASEAKGTKDMLEPKVLEAKIAATFTEYRDQQLCREFLRRNGVTRRNAPRDPESQEAPRPKLYHGIRIRRLSPTTDPFAPSNDWRGTR